MSYREAIDRARRIFGAKAHAFVAYDGTHVVGGFVYDPFRYGFGLVIYREGTSWDAVFRGLPS